MTDPICIPEDLFIPALNETAKETMKGFDSWGEWEATQCRRKLPPEYHIIESDNIKRWAIRLRKAGKLEGTGKGNSGKRPVQDPKGNYAKYLTGEHWRWFRQVMLKFWNYRCALCNSLAELEVYHRSYDNVGRERLNDCIVLCNTCHRRVHYSMPEGNVEFEKHTLIEDLGL